MTESNNEKDTLNMVSMSIIIHAGNARTHTMKILEDIAEGNFDNVETALSEANVEITEAHVLQTDILQKEANGQQMIYSALFNHAQDTLMTVKSEVLMTAKLAKIFKTIFKKIS